MNRRQQNGDSRFLDFYLGNVVDDLPRLERSLKRLLVASCIIFALVALWRTPSLPQALFAYFLANYWGALGGFLIKFALDILDLDNLWTRYPRSLFVAATLLPLIPFWTMIAFLTVEGFLRNSAPGSPDPSSPPGFLWGFAHGWTALVNLGFETIGYRTRIFEPTNAGWSYDLGYLIGLLCGLKYFLNVFSAYESRQKHPLPTDAGTAIEMRSIADGQADNALPTHSATQPESSAAPSNPRESE